MANSQNGSVRNALGYIIGFGTVTGMIFAVVQWGLKLEKHVGEVRTQNVVLTDRVARLEASVERGVLKVAETRLDELDRRVTRIEEES